MDLSERDESDSSSSHHSRSANRVTNDGRQEERSGPSENRFDRMERILEGMLTHVTRNEPSRHTTHVLDQYRRQRPPVFRGKAEDDPCMAEYWMEQTEKLLQHLQCSDEDKVNCATFMLEEDAARWWQSAQRALQRTPSWREEKTWEFMKLKQTDEMSVTQYDVKFTQLIRYVPMYEADEWQKAQKFVGGLKVGLQQALSSWTLDTYNEALHRALSTETNLLRVSLIRSDEKKKDPKGGEHKSDGRNSKSNEPCSRCGKVHSGKQCFQGHIRCFSCGEEGHKKNDCPKNKEAPPTGNRMRITCFSCQQPGHYSSECPKRQKVEQMGKANEAQKPRHGRVFYLSKDDDDIYWTKEKGTSS
ncbi:uncharacterized protein LOC127804438 [Diospyros lotus]|uniref:uncharacterized protein LOC127804438 n=1 Tax=Diospyros lotus TaxID=55363 RepID=UPI002255B1DF|nr:uncharacterized protein LOC127804438 [Diospyros lotus]